MSDSLLNVRSQTLMHSLSAIAATGERLSNEAEAQAFAVLDEAFTKAGAKVSTELVPLFVSTVDACDLRTSTGESISALGNAMTCPLANGSPRQGEITAQGVVHKFSTQAWKEQKDSLHGIVPLLAGLPYIGAIRKAQDLGAAAILFCTGERIHRMIVSDVYGSPDEESSFARYVTLPNLSIDEKGAQALTDGDTVTIRETVNSRWTLSQVLTAVFGNPEAKDFLLLTGHIDSWGPGAADNASGIAAMIGICEAIQEKIKAKTCRFNAQARAVIWSGHSHGRYAGSSAWCDRHYEELSAHCFLNINLDVLGVKGSIVKGTAPAMACTNSLFIHAHEAVGFSEPCHPTRFPRACDQSFLMPGIPTLFSNIGEVPPQGATSLAVAGLSGIYGPLWHTTDDTVEGIDEKCLLRDAQIAGDAVYHALIKGPKCLDLAAEAQAFRDRIQESIATMRSCAQRIAERGPREQAFVDSFLRADSLLLLPLNCEMLAMACAGDIAPEKILPLSHLLVAMHYCDLHAERYETAGIAAIPLFERQVRKLAQATDAALASPHPLLQNMALWTAWTGVVRAAKELDRHAMLAVDMARPPKRKYPI